MPRQQVATGDGVATTVQLAKAYTDDGGYQVTDPPDMRRRLMEMEGKRTQLEREAKELGEPAVVEMHPGLAEVYRRKVETLQTALANDTDPERRQQAITILRSLVDRVVLTPGEGRGKLQIELVGDLWSLMQLARQAEGRAGELDVMTVVVAGARFELTTFRL